MKSLVIVESGAKAKKIKGYLDSNFPDKEWQVEACVGHVRDLSDKESAVDPNDWNNLKWEFSTKGKKVMRELRKYCKESDLLYLATDPDREGEAIAWHLLSDFDDKKLIKGIDVKRVTFNEITSSAIKKAIESPREIDRDLVDAYLTRRILDHLIGFKVSPLLWRHVSRAKSAGRVQSPTLRILCEKEDERDLHIPEEYWPFESSFDFLGTSIEAKLTQISERNINKEPLKDEVEVNNLINELGAASFQLRSIESKAQSSSPKPPFRTSTLQMSAASGLGFTADRTMQSAQKLYEGGLITYLRTDGISISTSPNTGEPFSEDNPGPPPLQEIRNFISSNYDSTFLSKEPRIYKSKVQNSQEAHEAIRPTDISMMPSVSGLSGDEEKLYTLIWNRTVASQMESSRYERKTLVISSTDNKYEFRASSRKNIFKGFEVLTGTDDEKVTLFPEGLEEESELSLILNKYEQKFTLPPNRFSEASLIKKMEEEGIGRPSTYATIVKGLRTKKYAYGAKSIIPSDLGRVLTSYLKKVFEEFFIETEFTARMEEDLDKVASGNKNYEDVLNAFWAELQNYLNRKINDIEISNKDEFKTRQVLDLLNEELGSIIFPKDESGQNRNECPKCSSPISLKSGAWGYFVGCSECKWTKKPFEFNTTWETYQELPKDLGVHPDLGKPIYADLSVNGPCVWTFNEEEKKLFGTPDEDEFILDIGLNRAIELIDTSNAENILFTEINSNLPIVLKNGRFGEYTEFDGFNKATKLKPEDKDPNPKVSYYEPNTIDYQSDSGRRYVLNSLRILGFIHKEDKSVQPVGIKIRKPGKAFKFIKNLKVGEVETEIPNDWYKLDPEEQDFILNEVLKLKKGERYIPLEDSKVV
jgi:DNA topoisomerase-1